MGTYDQFQMNRKDIDVRMCANVLIVASPRHTDKIDWSSDSDAFPGLTILPCENTASVPHPTAAAASLVILEIDPHSRVSMNRLHDLKRDFPDLPVVAAIADASVSLVRTLVRESVADVVALPFNFEEVLETAVSVLASAKRRDDHLATLAPMFAVVRSIGGCGATSVATHLAAALAENDPSGKGIAIVDLDLQFGSVADFLGGAGRGSISDLLEAKDRLDEDLIRSVARVACERISIFAAPDEIMPLETVDTDKLLHVLAALRRQYGYVVLDLPANWTNWTLSAVSAANLVVMVVELSVASLRQAKRRLELFSSLGISRKDVEIVVNRVERRLFRTIDLSDVESTLGHSVLGGVAVEEPLVGSAQDQGLLVSQVQRKSRFAADIGRIADAIVARCPQTDAA